MPSMDFLEPRGVVFVVINEIVIVFVEVFVGIFVGVVIIYVFFTLSEVNAFVGVVIT